MLLCLFCLFLFLIGSIVRYSTYNSLCTVNLLLHGDSNINSHILLNLLNKLMKMADKIRGMPTILSPLPNEYNTFNCTGARMCNCIHHMIPEIVCYDRVFLREKVRCHIYAAFFMGVI